MIQISFELGVKSNWVRYPTHFAGYPTHFAGYPTHFCIGTMSATMLRQMLVDAAAFLKAERYQEAQDAGRRVTQFDPNNFQAFMCVGLASFHLQQVRPSTSSLSLIVLSAVMLCCCSGKTVRRRTGERPTSNRTCRRPGRCLDFSVHGWFLYNWETEWSFRVVAVSRGSV